MQIYLKSDSDRLLKRADSDRSEIDPKFSVTVHTRHVLSQIDLRSILRCSVNRPYMEEHTKKSIASNKEEDCANR